MSKKHKKTLLLNADFTPLRLMPVSTIPWERAMILLFDEKATVIEYYDDYITSAGGEKYRLPSVIVLRKYVFFNKHAKYSKRNVKLRDSLRCQYCNKRHSERSLTVDHVIPRAKGGTTCWENIVSACKPCNFKKKDRTDMKPITKPARPNYYSLSKKLLSIETQVRHPSWEKYIKV